MLEVASDEQLQDGVFDLAPSFGSGVDQVEVAGGWNLKQVKVFFFFAGALLFGGEVIPTENGGNYVIFVAMDQPLTGFGDRKLHGVCFAVMVGDFLGSAAEEFDNCVVTEVKLISTFKVDDSSERDDANHAGFVCG